MAPIVSPLFTVYVTGVGVGNSTSVSGGIGVNVGTGVEVRYGMRSGEETGAGVALDPPQAASPARRINPKKQLRMKELYLLYAGTCPRYQPVLNSLHG